MLLQSMKEKSHSNVKDATIGVLKKLTWLNMLIQSMKEENHSNVMHVIIAFLKKLT